MTAFKIIYAVWCLVATVDNEASYEAYQEWCESPQAIDEVQLWDCIPTTKTTTMTINL